MTPQCLAAWKRARIAPLLTAIYDALGRMVENNAGGSYTEIIYGPTGKKLATANGTTLIKAFIALPGGAKAIYNSTGLAYYRHSDWLGSSRLTSTATRPTSMYSSTAYAPYGESQQSQTSGTADASFTGQDQDTVSNLYDFPARRYSPSQGRWTSPDPAGLSAADSTNPETWNRYAYVGNNPLSFIDPLGLAWLYACTQVNGGQPDCKWYWEPEDGSAPASGGGTGGGEAGVGAGGGGPSNAANNGTPQTPQKTPCAVPSGNRLSLGASVQVATVNPFTSGGGGVWGANQQSFGATTYNYTYSGTGAGLDVGASIQSAWAWGSGSWGGPFKSISFSAGPFSGSIFWTPGKGGWTGASFGLGVGSPGAAYEVTNYTCKSGPG